MKHYYYSNNNYISESTGSKDIHENKTSLKSAFNVSNIISSNETLLL